MSYNGSGVYTLPGAQLANGEIVSATENNQFRNDVATALNTAWTRDGQAPATANIPMGSHKFTGLAAGTGAGDSIRYEQFASPPAIGNTAANTGAFTTLSASGNVTLGDASTDTLNVGNGDLVKDASGNVGIGTSSPSSFYSLADNLVVGTGSGGNGITIYSGSADSGYIGFNDTASASMQGFIQYNHSGDYMAFAPNGSERMRIDSSGNVGIGTSSPASRLQLSGAGSTTLTMTDSSLASGNGGTCIITAIKSGVGYHTLQLGPSMDIRFQTGGGTEAARIDSSGKIYANTTDTASQDGQLNVKVTVAGAQSIDLWNSATSGTRYHMKFRDNTTATVRGSITSDGTNTAFNTSSDYRLKENIKDLPNALETVNQLQPRQFNWKETGKKTTGFIAHELQAVVPDCVTGEKDAVDEDGKPVYQGIDTSFLVATLTAAIKELKAELDATKAEVAALKGN